MSKNDSFPALDYIAGVITDELVYLFSLIRELIEVIGKGTIEDIPPS